MKPEAYSSTFQRIRSQAASVQHITTTHFPMLQFINDWSIPRQFKDAVFNCREYISSKHFNITFLSITGPFNWLLAKQFLVDILCTFLFLPAVLNALPIVFPSSKSIECIDLCEWVRKSVLLMWGIMHVSTMLRNAILLKERWNGMMETTTYLTN